MPKPEMSYRIPVHAATLLLISHDLSSTMTAPVWDGHGHTAVFKTDKNEDLLESTGNSAQCHVAAGTGGGFGGGRVREYVWLSPLTAHLKLSQHRSSATLQCKIKSFKEIKNKTNKQQKKDSGLSSHCQGYSGIMDSSPIQEGLWLHQCPNINMQKLPDLYNKSQKTKSYKM